MNFKAVIFDLDGVISKTALVHSAAWTRMFNDYLKSREKRFGEVFKAFSHEHDYLTYVDGKPRYEGVKSFLESRGISIPRGDPSDSPDKETICGLGNKKNEAFNLILKEDGVQIYDSTLAFIHELKNAGIRIGVASSSKNCRQVLEAAGIIDLFEVRIDGKVSSELGIKGKPEPDIFTLAADNLGVFYDQCVIIEDAVSGVQAGANGNFGLVLGVAREGNEKELLLNGADKVVTDLSEISIDVINDWFLKGLKDDRSLTYLDYDPEKEKSREALLTIGNGYAGIRGSMDEIRANNTNYPGTYIAGLYNRLVSKVGDKNIENEDFVNCPNCLPITFRINDGKCFDPNDAIILDIERKLDFRNGLLFRRMIIKDNDGFESMICSKRFISMENPHLMAISYSITPLNYSGMITVLSAIDGNIINDGVPRYRQLNQQHLSVLSCSGKDNESCLLAETTQSAIQIALASKLSVFKDEQSIVPVFQIEKSDKLISNCFTVNMTTDHTLSIEKIVSIYTSKDQGVSDPLFSAQNDIHENHSFLQVFTQSKAAWTKIWDEIDIEIQGDRKSQKLLRLHLYHLMVSASPHNKNIDASFTARGLHGEAYRGHIFWDELFIIPFHNIHFPETAKASLMYRYHRLKKAKEYAEAYGYKGAMFPWQSGSHGREETQIMHLNPLTAKWGADYSSLQRHVSLAIAYNVWQYVHCTDDLDFLTNYGAELFLEICRFWASKCKLKAETGRYSIDKVMGPDEFHEKYPDSEEGGLKDNAYTNIMVVWCFNKAFEILKKMPAETMKSLFDRIGLNEDELSKWKEISLKMNIVVNKEGIIAQYDGYFDLKELDWNYFREKYSNIHRLDRILKAEGKSPDAYKVAKQADTLMTFYNLEVAELDAIMQHLRYRLPPDYLIKNLKYYLARTSHGSTLSKVVHSQLSALTGNNSLCWELFTDALASDYNDIQGGTTGEGIHSGVMAGTIMIALNTFAGLDLRTDRIKIKPNLPKHWREMKFNCNFKGHPYEIKIKGQSAEINHVLM